MTILRAREIRLTVSNEQIRAIVGDTSAQRCTGSGATVTDALRDLAGKLEQWKDVQVWVPHPAKQYREGGVLKADCPECGRTKVFTHFDRVIAFVCDGCGYGVDVDDDEAGELDVVESSEEAEAEEEPREPPSLADRFPIIPHQGNAAGQYCCGCIVAEGAIHESTTTLRCNECEMVVGTINTGILVDLVNLASATDLDQFVPDADHINALPGPLRRYIHDLETRADPAGDVAEIALLKENNAALWARIRELESQIPPPN
jgi:endogenous inhibitor of DNA gyrase (YacG/DUF329 family)